MIRSQQDGKREAARHASTPGQGDTSDSRRGASFGGLRFIAETLAFLENCLDSLKRRRGRHAAQQELRVAA